MQLDFLVIPTESQIDGLLCHRFELLAVALDWVGTASRHVQTIVLLVVSLCHELMLTLGALDELGKFQHFGHDGPDHRAGNGQEEACIL